MRSNLNSDLATAHEELDTARDELLAVLTDLPDDALDRFRRGGWTVQRVLQHLIEAEWHYAALVTQLGGRPVAPAGERGEPTAVAEAVRRLTTTRRALLEALDGIDEASYYRLGTVGREEYSVLSVLENVAHHDREHAAQLRSIVASRSEAERA